MILSFRYRCIQSFPSFYSIIYRIDINHFNLTSFQFEFDSRIKTNNTVTPDWSILSMIPQTKTSTEYTLFMQLLVVLQLDGAYASRYLQFGLRSYLLSYQSSKFYMYVLIALNKMK